MATMSLRNFAQQIGSSLKEAWIEMAADNPNELEEQEIRRAIELSLLDCALVQRSSTVNAQQQKPVSDYQVLKIKPTATLQEIKASYRKMAIATHPDKGGERGEFEKVALAYRNLLAMHSSATSSLVGGEDHRDKKHIKTTAHWDNELKEHAAMVSELFASHSANLQQNIQKQQAVLNILELRHKEAGSINVNENQERIRNSCFYLSLAVSYLEGIGALMLPFAGNNDVEHWDVDPEDLKFMQEADLALISQTALQLKRIIEGAVLKAHPEWAQQGLVGEEVQAFSDFLVYTLQSDTVLTDLAVVIFDETSGFVDVFKGSFYGKKNSCSTGDEDDWARRSNTLTLRFVPGHYQPLLPMESNHNKRPTLEEILTTLDLEGVFYVVTDGSA